MFPLLSRNWWSRAMEGTIMLGYEIVAGEENRTPVCILGS